MATQLEHDNLDIEEQLVRIRRAREESEEFSAETHRMVAEMLKAQAETKIMPWSTIFQAMLATAALLGAGATITRLFYN